MQFKSFQPPGAMYVIEYMCVFVIPLNGFFLDLMEQVPSQGNGLHHKHKVKRFETGEKKLRTSVPSICERQNIYEIPGWIVCISLFVCVHTHVLCCHDNSSLNGREPVAAFANPLPFLAFLCDTNLIQTSSNCDMLTVHSCI